VPGETILIVDDNAANLKLMNFVLSSSGYDVHTATDGETALALLEAWHPRLILLDLQLPGINGFEVARRLKGAPETRGIVIVAVTAYAMTGDEQRALDAGCDHYLTKPVDTRALPGFVARLLESRGAPGAPGAPSAPSAPGAHGAVES